MYKGVLYQEKYMYGCSFQRSFLHKHPYSYPDHPKGVLTWETTANQRRFLALDEDAATAEVLHDQLMEIVELVGGSSDMEDYIEEEVQLVLAGEMTLDQLKKDII